MPKLCATQTTGHINMFVIFQELKFWKICSHFCDFLSFVLTDSNEMHKVTVIYDEQCIH